MTLSDRALVGVAGNTRGNRCGFSSRRTIFDKPNKWYSQSNGTKIKHGITDAEDLRIFDTVGISRWITTSYSVCERTPRTF